MTAIAHHRRGYIGLTDREAQFVRNTARILGLISLAVFIVLSFRNGPPQSFREEGWETQVQLAVLATVGLGYLVAWKWDWLGGGILVFGSIVLGALAAIALEPSRAVIPCLAFFIPGALYLLYWQRRAGLLHIAGLVVGLGAALTAGGVAAAQIYNYYTGPTHPSSDIELPPVDLVSWIWAGATTQDAFTVKALLEDGVTQPVLLVSTSQDLAGALEFAPSSVGTEDYPLATFRATGLEAGVEHFYAIRNGDHVDTGRRGSLRTFPVGPASFTFAIGSCARVGSNGRVFDRIREADPLLFIASGDFHYTNITTNDIDRFRNAYAKQIEQPAQQALYLSTSIAYVWDDHDFGGDGSDRTAEARDAALFAYRENAPHYPLGLEGADAPIGQAFTVGRVRFIMTDNRSARDPKDIGGVRNMMGDEQKAWFKNELLAANGEYPLIVWVNAVPWIAKADPTADNWGGFAAERAEIAEFVKENDIQGLFIVSGDAHMLAIDDGTNSSYAAGVEKGPVVFHAAALDRLGSVKGGPYSEGAYPGGGQFGLVEVEDDGGDTITLRLSGRNYKDEEKVGYTFSVPATPEGGR